MVLGRGWEALVHLDFGEEQVAFRHRQFSRGATLGAVLFCFRGNVS
jgi:hypothetical protein